MKTNKLKFIVSKENKYFIAKAVNFELASQGFSKVEAIKNLEEAHELLRDGK